jgi:hypothetical protein
MASQLGRRQAGGLPEDRRRAFEDVPGSVERGGPTGEVVDRHQRARPRMGAVPALAAREIRLGGLER